LSFDFVFRLCLCTDDFVLFVLLDFKMKRFAIAVSIGLLAFALANLVSLFLRSDDVDEPDSKDRWGFPLLVSEEFPGWSGGHSIPDQDAYFSRAALVADLSIFTLGSAAVAGVFNVFRQSRAGYPTMSLHSTPR
jgi:hypothetical protein